MISLEALLGYILLFTVFRKDDYLCCVMLSLPPKSFRLMLTAIRRYGGRRWVTEAQPGKKLKVSQMRDLFKLNYKDSTAKCVCAAQQNWHFHNKTFHNNTSSILRPLSLNTSAGSIHYINQACSWLIGDIFVPLSKDSNFFLGLLEQNMACCTVWLASFG